MKFVIYPLCFLIETQPIFAQIPFLFYFLDKLLFLLPHFVELHLLQLGDHF